MTTDLIVDTPGVFARAWYAVTGQENGTPAKVVSAALSTLLSLLSPHNDKLSARPTHLLCAWDGRHKRDKGRDPKPDVYYESRDLFKETLLFLLSPAYAESDTVEADDIVATAVTQSTASKIIVVSGDKDLQQLAGGRVGYYCLHTKSMLSVRQIIERWKIKKPSQLAIALAILGDPVDQIAGIKGWGKKTVGKLFQQVTPEMEFTEALAAIEALIPRDRRERFYEDLNLTLLDGCVPGVPAPAPIQPADLDAARALDLPDLLTYYQPVYRVYAAKQSANALDVAEDDA